MTSRPVAAESLPMRVFRKLGMDPIAWSLRRLYCPVGRDALVLEVGSGASPYFRANVLCDAYEETQERFYAHLVRDRPTILAFGERLPFKDGSFDFVIASHVLEHSAEPEKFLSEIQRVGKAGYIEGPDAFMERLTHYGFHRLEIADTDGQLVIRKKKHYIQDEEVVGLFHNKARSIFPNWVSRFPFHFHVRYFWNRESGGIKYRILNPECDASWDGPQSSAAELIQNPAPMAIIKQRILAVIRRLFSQNSRNKSLDLMNLLECPNCHRQSFKLQGGHAVCEGCQAKHSVYLPCGTGNSIPA
ncbi:MAG: class I SAM-dependent methyltransferase [Nitrospira sp.]|nr:class I SAM-dependent methyltransferase [Nitrospira sp.]